MKATATERVPEVSSIDVRAAVHYALTFLVQDQRHKQLPVLGMPQREVWAS
jgi:hypothetical protein